METLHQFSIKVNAVPNISSVLSEIATVPGKEYPVEVDSEIEIDDDHAYQIAYEGVVQEILGAVIAGLDIELIPAK